MTVLTIFLTGYGGVSSKTTTTSDSGHTNGFLPNGGGGSSNGVGSGGGVWAGETLSSLSGKSSAESSSGDGDGSDDRFFSVDGYATGSRRLTAHARQQQQRLQGRLAPPPAPPYRDARRGGEDLVPSSR